MILDPAMEGLGLRYLIFTVSLTLLEDIIWLKGKLREEFGSDLGNKVSLSYCVITATVIRQLGVRSSLPSSFWEFQENWTVGEVNQDQEIMKEYNMLLICII